MVLTAWVQTSTRPKTILPMHTNHMQIGTNDITRCKMLLNGFNSLIIANRLQKVWSRATIIVGFFNPVSSLKVIGHSIHSERRRIYLGDQYKLFRMTPLSYHDYSVSGSSTQQCSDIPLKLIGLFSSLLVPHKNFFVKYVISIDLLWLSETRYKPKLSHGLACYFMLDRLHWCAKQWNRTSVLLGDLW